MVWSSTTVPLLSAWRALVAALVDHRLLVVVAPVLRTRKGQFAVFDKAAAALLTAIILPVPTERSKGVVLCRTIFGNVLVGPTAEEAVPALLEALTDESRELRESAAEALQKIDPNAAKKAGVR